MELNNVIPEIGNYWIRATISCTWGLEHFVFTSNMVSSLEVNPKISVSFLSLTVIRTLDLNKFLAG